MKKCYFLFLKCSRFPILYILFVYMSELVMIDFDSTVIRGYVWFIKKRINKVGNYLKKYKATT